MEKTCLVIYVGVGYSDFEYNWDKTYIFSVNMMDGYENHQKNVFEPLKRQGYSIKTALLTKKHKRYDEMLKFYDAITLEYDDINEYESNALQKFHKVRDTENTGFFQPGGRFLTLKTPIDHYDLYVIIRGDVLFKKSFDEINIDYDKVNFLWPESPPELSTHKREKLIQEGWYDLMWWDRDKRTNGIVFNVLPKKYFNLYKSHIWREHLALSYMIRDTYPLFSMEDVNMIMGFDKGYTTDLRFMSNPIYTFNKKIISHYKDIVIENFGNLN